MSKKKKKKHQKRKLHRLRELQRLEQKNVSLKLKPKPSSREAKTTFPVWEKSTSDLSVFKKDLRRVSLSILAALIVLLGCGLFFFYYSKFSLIEFLNRVFLGK